MKRWPGTISGVALNVPIEPLFICIVTGISPLRYEMTYDVSISKLRLVASGVGRVHPEFDEGHAKPYRGVRVGSETLL